MKRRSTLIAATLALASLAGSALSAATGDALAHQDGTGRSGGRKGMKVISPIFSDMSGKLGGAVAAKARGGVQYMRSLVIPGNPKTQAQTRARNALTSVAACWRATLSDSERAAWDGLAVGEKSGIDVFMAPNALRVLAGQAIVEVAPATLATVFTPPTGASVDDTGAVTLTGLTATDDYNATAGGAIHVFVSRPQSSSRLSQQFPFTRLGSNIRAGAALTQFTGDMTSLYGDPAVGQIIYIRAVVTTSDGRVSNEQIFRVTVTGG